MRSRPQLKRQQYPRLKVVWADGKYDNHGLRGWLNEQRRRLPWKLEIVRRSKDASGFVLLPKRWVVGRTSAWLGRPSRQSRDYERRTDSSECQLRLTAIHQLLKRRAPDARHAPFHYRLAA